MRARCSRRATSSAATSVGRAVDAAPRLAAVGAGVAPAIVIFFLYNQVRFGSPWESGYGLATLPEFLEQQRALGLFALAHLGMNIDYFLLHLPTVIPTFPFFQPDGLGHVGPPHQPGAALREPGRLAPAAAPGGCWARRSLVLIPTLLYYGGGWLQYGYRYFLDSVPFVIGAVRAGGGEQGPGRHRLDDAHRASGRSSWRSASTGATSLMDVCARGP